MANKIKLALLENNLTSKDVYEAMGLDKSDFSKITNGKLLPNGPAAKILMDLTKRENLNQLLNQQDIEIYSQHIFKALQAPKKTNAEQDIYKLCVRLPKGRCNLLQQPQTLHRLGYLNLTDWVFKQFLKLEKQLNKLDHQEKYKEATKNDM